VRSSCGVGGGLDKVSREKGSVRLGTCRSRRLSLCNFTNWIRHRLGRQLGRTSTPASPSVPPFLLCFNLNILLYVGGLIRVRLLSQVHGKSSAASQSSLHPQAGTSFEASEETPQEATSWVRLFCGHVRITDVHLIPYSSSYSGPKGITGSMGQT
jgi:hypothetical protein